MLQLQVHDRERCSRLTSKSSRRNAKDMNVGAPAGREKRNPSRGMARYGCNSRMLLILVQIEIILYLFFNGNNLRENSEFRRCSVC